MKYKAKKGISDDGKALSLLGNYHYQKLINNKPVEIDSLPKGWDKYVEPVSNKPKKKEDKE
tara:strand:- start:8709 stop:8891 length:183 start_codon:yes stop_codon:yes gene_type:complete